jgi:hypothetical protein
MGLTSHREQGPSYFVILNKPPGTFAASHYQPFPKQNEQSMLQQ